MNDTQPVQKQDIERTNRILDAILIELRALRTDRASVQPTIVRWAKCPDGYHDGDEIRPTWWRCKKCGFEWEFDIQKPSSPIPPSPTESD